MHGDFEAQRHWMELTRHIPVKKWYFYELEWWGLDYPPLTAYHSWLCGVIGTWIESSWFALDTSRGMDDAGLKAYMRGTAVLSELFIYVPAVLIYVKFTAKQDNMSAIGQCLSAAAILFQPALILIDHGHFQYNSVMLGLALLAMVWIQQQRYYSACIVFVCSIMFKQMALYYVPAVAGCLLGAVTTFSISPFRFSVNMPRLFVMGLITISAFAACVLPLVIFSGTDSLSVLQQMVIRIFPFSRGLWEDKVANFWCSANVFIKFKRIFTPEKLQQLSLLATLAAVVPVMLALVFASNRKRQALLPWAFAASAWGFFLFSFQVHEKSVLLPLMPTTMLIASAKNNKNSNILSLVFWINNVASFSIWPLLKRENLHLQFFAMVMCWNWLVGNFNFLTSWRSEHKLRTHLIPSYPSSSSSSFSFATLFWRFVLISSYVAMAAIHIAEAFVQAPKQYPDFYVVLNILVAGACFGLFWIYTLYQVLIGVGSGLKNKNSKKR